jgi:glutaminyl-peptide cyclotransferase
MRLSKWLPPLAVVSTFVLTGCPADKKPAETAGQPTETQAPKAPAFNADSAYAFTAKQVAFGPRVPNKPAHVACGDYLVAKLKKFGLTVREQPFTAMTFDGTQIRGRNIIAQYQPQAARRIAIFAHWDTRPFADADKEHKNAPMDGASDGASAVAVAMEIARSLSQQPSIAAPNVGVDIMLMDAEDWGWEADTQANIKDQLDETNGNSSCTASCSIWWGPKMGTSPARVRRCKTPVAQLIKSGIQRLRLAIRTTSCLPTRGLSSTTTYSQTRAECQPSISTTTRRMVLTSSPLTTTLRPIT